MMTPNSEEATDDGIGWFSDEAATFGDRVAGAREALGMTDEDLARRLGVKIDTLRNWEDDLAEPRANKLQMLSGVLNVSMSWLLTGTGNGPNAPDGDTEATLDARQLLTELKQARADLARTGKRLATLEAKLSALLPET